jgi:hypothetical protein
LLDRSQELLAAVLDDLDREGLEQDVEDVARTMRSLWLQRDPNFEVDSTELLDLVREIEPDLRSGNESVVRRATSHYCRLVALAARIKKTERRDVTEEISRTLAGCPASDLVQGKLLEAVVQEAVRHPILFQLELLGALLASEQLNIVDRGSQFLDRLLAHICSGLEDVASCDNEVVDEIQRIVSMFPKRADVLLPYFEYLIRDRGRGRVSPRDDERIGDLRRALRSDADQTWRQEMRVFELLLARGCKEACQAYATRLSGKASSQEWCSTVELVLTADREDLIAEMVSALRVERLNPELLKSVATRLGPRVGLPGLARVWVKLANHSIGSNLEFAMGLLDNARRTVPQLAISIARSLSRTRSRLLRSSEKLGIENDVWLHYLAGDERALSRVLEKVIKPRLAGFLRRDWIRYAAHHEDFLQDLTVRILTWYRRPAENLPDKPRVLLSASLRWLRQVMRDFHQKHGGAIESERPDHEPVRASLQPTASLILECLKEWQSEDSETLFQRLGVSQRLRTRFCNLVLLWFSREGWQLDLNEIMDQCTVSRPTASRLRKEIYSHMAHDLPAPTYR